MSDNEIKPQEFVVKWTIHNFLPLDKSIAENDLKSPTFFTDDGTEWQLQLCSDENYVSLYLHFIFSNSCHVSATLNFAIINADGTCKCLQALTEYTFSNSAKFCGWKEYISLDVLLENKNYLVPDGHFTVLCQVTLLPTKKRNSQFVEDMSKLLNDKEFSDVELSARGTKFSAHKLILARRSPVFREILRTHQENSVIDVDIDADVFKKLLQFIYTGCDHYLHQNVATMAKDLEKDLIIAANKYRINDLEDVCVDFLCNDLSVKNVVEMAMFAAREKLDKLRTRIIERITSEFVKKDADCIIKELFNIIDGLNR